MLFEVAICIYAMFVLVKCSTAHWCVLLTHIHKHNYLTQSVNSKHQSPRKHFQCMSPLSPREAQKLLVICEGLAFVEDTTELHPVSRTDCVTMSSMCKDENCFSNCPEVP